MCSLSPKLNRMCMIRIRISAEDLLSITGYMLKEYVSCDSQVWAYTVLPEINA